jgi:hypothetical protein
MSAIRRFWTQASIHYRNFQLAYGAMGVVCAMLALLAIVAPGWLLGIGAAIDGWLGGAAWSVGELGRDLVRTVGAAYFVASALMFGWVRRDVRNRRLATRLLMFVHGSGAAALIGGFGLGAGHPSLLVAAGGEFLVCLTVLGFAGVASADIQGVPDPRLVPEPVGTTPLGWTYLEQRWVDAVIRASLPANPSTGHPGVGGVDLEEFWPSYMRRVPLHFRLGLRASTWVLGLWPIVTGRTLGTFVSLDDDGRDEVLQEVAESRFFVVRQIIFILKTTVGFAYFSDPDMRKQFPSAYAERSGLDDTPGDQPDRPETEREAAKSPPEVAADGGGIAPTAEQPPAE